MLCKTVWSMAVPFFYLNVGDVTHYFSVVQRAGSLRLCKSAILLICPTRHGCMGSGDNAIAGRDDEYVELAARGND